MTRLNLRILASPSSRHSFQSHHRATSQLPCLPYNTHLPQTTLNPMARRRRPPRPGALTELPPLKILTQILILQLIWYAVATALILFTALVAGKSFSFDLVLSWRSLRGDTTVGWMLGLVWLLNSFIGYVSFSFPFVSAGVTSWIGNGALGKEDMRIRMRRCGNENADGS
jgi:hypothetical protein